MIRFRFVTAHGVAGFLIGAAIPYIASKTSNQPFEARTVVVSAIVCAMLCAIAATVSAAVANRIASVRFRNALTFVLLIGILFALVRAVDMMVIHQMQLLPEVVVTFAAGVATFALAATMRSPAQPGDRGV